MVHKCAEEKRDEIKKEIAEYLAGGGKVGVKTDEWSCGPKRKRFLGVCLTMAKRNVSLGLKPMTGSVDAKALKVLIVEKLNDYGVKLYPDVVSVSCDGCSLMVKLGKDLKKELKNISQQLCLAHAIHLGTIYKVQKTKAKSNHIFEVSFLKTNISCHARRARRN